MDAFRSPLGGDFKGGGKTGSTAVPRTHSKMSAAETVGNAFRIRYIAPDTCGVAMDVPVNVSDAHEPPMKSDRIFHPGAAIFTVLPQLLVGCSSSPTPWEAALSPMLATAMTQLSSSAKAPG